MTGRRQFGIALLALVAATGLAALATRALLGPPAGELLVLASVLALTGFASLGAALLARMLVPALLLRWQIVVASCTGLILVVVNLLASAWLMFLSPHDLQLLLVLCGFALAASVAPVLLISQPVERRIVTLERAARDVAAGNLSRRIPVSGNDEVASLSRAFNEMAHALDTLEMARTAEESSRRALYAAISHDLRTPLSTMRAMVEAMTDGVVTDPATCSRYLRAVSSEIDHLTSLINDLFELTKIEAGDLKLRLEWLDVTEVLGQALESFRPQFEEARISASFEGPSATAAHADPERLVRVVYNLLHNALRHTPHDGTIVVRAEPLEDGHVRVAVSNTGEGIPPADVPCVFERFFRGDRARSRDRAGSGLGLSIARGIVEGHGGAIGVESAAVPGTTTIAFTLPSDPARDSLIPANL